MSRPPPALAADHHDWQDEAAGGLRLFRAGPPTAPPLLLVHSVNAAASAAEVRPVFEALAGERQVWALDLPGYGGSERSDRAYTPRLMTDALHAAARHIRQRRMGLVATPQPPLDALALSTSCEFLARAAVEQPAQWGRLALVSPTGLAGGHPRRGAPGQTRAVPGLHRALSQRLWAQPLFDALTRPSVVRYFLRRTCGRDDIDAGLWEQAVAQARAPGARFAPLHFLSAGLFSADALPLYEALTQPVWLSHGVRGDFTDYRQKALLQGRPGWRFTVWPGGAMPWFEQPAEFARALQAFLRGEG